jgi:hypothetical protein
VLFELGTVRTDGKVLIRDDGDGTIGMEAVTFVRNFLKAVDKKVSKNFV